MSCILSIVGENFDVDAFVIKIQMSGFNKRYKGDPLGGSKLRKNKYSGASITTSSADFDDIKGQIEDTIHFLNEHKHNLKVIASTPGVEYATINFGVNSAIDDNRLTQSFYFTKDLIKICAELDIEIELSIYKEDMQVILEKACQENKAKNP